MEQSTPIPVDLSCDPSEYRLKFSEDYVVRHTLVPDKIDNIPHIIGWSGPARSGTTALLYLLASHPDVDRAYFQPQKTLMRKGGPNFKFFEGDRTICMKEVFGGDYSSDVGAHDPIDLLIRAGIPREKITWVTILREPQQAFGSLHSFEPVTPTSYAAAQDWALKLFYKYRGSEVEMVPFVYDLVSGREDEVLRALFDRIGLQLRKQDLVFNPRAISAKLVPGQLGDKRYFNAHVRKTLQRKQYVYSRNNHQLSEQHTGELEELCGDDYRVFSELARADLKISRGHIS